MKEDLRVKKTKIALVQAMITLLENQSFRKITVNDLCREAMVSRSAFYVHFEDKYVLLRFCLEEIKKQSAEEHMGLPVKERILLLLKIIQAHSGIFTNLLVKDLDEEVADMLWTSFLEDFRDTGYQKDSGSAPLLSLELASAYYGAGISSVIILWITKGLPYSAEEVAQCLYQLLEHVI